MHRYIEIKNARIHNLRGIDVKIPKNKMTVITGVSGSGKSSLAFDILYEEGKKRYLTFSCSQFFVDNKNNFDSITGLSPAVAVEQRIIRQSNSRSTVATRINLDVMIATLYANFGVINSEYDNGYPLEIAMFQKNSPKGMCIKCLGSGNTFSIDEKKIFKDDNVTIANLFNGIQTHYRHLYIRLEILYGIKGERTIKSLNEEELQLFKYGDGGGNSGTSGYMGVIPWLRESYKYHLSKGRVNWITQLDSVGMKECPLCKGSGLCQESLHTTIGGKNISELESMYIGELYDFLKSNFKTSNLLVEKILSKLKGLIDVGLSYLTLSRKVPTLSGGELQRLFLAAYTMAEMDSIIFVFDEPTIGLHEIEKEKLINIMKSLVLSGNTVIAVEHDEKFIESADYVIEIGPGAGILGGEKIFEGEIKDFYKSNKSKIVQYIGTNTSKLKKLSYRPVNSERFLTVENATLHNLRNLTVNIPLGIMVGVAGVSGSGKSSLISDTLVPMLKEMLSKNCNLDEDDDEDSETIGNANCALIGVENLKKCFIIDQRPIGRNKTSCPATYTGIFERIRLLFANTKEAKEKKYGPGMFSRNSEGSCPKCKGEGIVHNYVGYGSFIDLTCDECGGTGYLKEAREILLDGKNIWEVLQLSVDEAITFFKDKDKEIETLLNILQKVGMGYIRLGQSTPSLSGGESQRIKLAKELAKGKKEKRNLKNGSLYILDEPTTGLSLYDTEKLLQILNELVDCGNSVIITEHDVHVLSNCDYIIEMGKGGGNEGGEIIAEGTPLELKNNSNSMIGRFLYA